MTAWATRMYGVNVSDVDVYWNQGGVNLPEPEGVVI
jgi:hypothetical protein